MFIPINEAAVILFDTARIAVPVFVFITIILKISISNTEERITTIWLELIFTFAICKVVLSIKVGKDFGSAPNINCPVY